MREDAHKAAEDLKALVESLLSSASFVGTDFFSQWQLCSGFAHGFSWAPPFFDGFAYRHVMEGGGVITGRVLNEGKALVLLRWGRQAISELLLRSVRTMPWREGSSPRWPNFLRREPLPPWERPDHATRNRSAAARAAGCRRPHGPGAAHGRRPGPAAPGRARRRIRLPLRRPVRQGLGRRGTQQISGGAALPAGSWPNWNAWRRRAGTGASTSPRAPASPRPSTCT